MAFDGITTACLAQELNLTLADSHISKITQTEKDELLLLIKLPSSSGGGTVRLILSADPSLPLCYLTQQSKPAPLTAPAFCMLLRKHLQGARILSISQPGLERIIRIAAEHRNELGDLCRYTLLIELMGKHSNIIFLDEQDVIIDSIRRVSQMISSVREVLPGRPYFVPDTQNKTDPYAETQQGFEQKLAGAGCDPASFIVRTYTGLSRVMAEELCARAALSQDASAAALAPAEGQRLFTALSGLLDDAASGRFAPVIYYHGREQEAAPLSPAEFSAVPLSIYKGAPFRSFETISALIETYYAQKNEQTRIRQKSSDLRHIVQTILERDIHKYDLQQKQLKDTEKRDKYRIWGELITAYAYSIPEGASKAELDNWYTGEKVLVPLDPALTASENARRYFDRYTKLKRTSEALVSLTSEVQAEIEHLRSIQTSLDLATDEADLAEIREELQQTGLIRSHALPSDKERERFKKAPAGGRKGSRRTEPGKPLHYLTSDGYDVYVGKNNTQNDHLTFHFAGPQDIWFHANDMPGSHVILCTRGEKFEDVPARAFEEAAALAAYYSSGRDQKKVEIDYLERRNVKKPGGSRPGFVVYYTNYSILASTDISSLTLVP